MRINLPKNDAKYHWTNHVIGKMIYYGLSAERVKRVMRSPHRSEKGIAPDTIAVMCPSKYVSRNLALRNNNEPARGEPKKPLFWKEEIWVMYTVKKISTPSLETENWKLKINNFSQPRKVIITAWRYPGVSKIREAIPIPNDILEELKNIKY